MDIRGLQRDIDTWSTINFPCRKPYWALLGLQEEVGELSHAHLKLEQGIRGTAAEHLAAKKDAVGDIFVYLADYCNKNGIDLQDAIEVTWAAVKCRDWASNPFSGVMAGVARKVAEDESARFFGTHTYDELAGPARLVPAKMVTQFACTQCGASCHDGVTVWVCGEPWCIPCASRSLNDIHADCEEDDDGF